ncbi:hypothetical protein DZC75_12155 [Pseudomonas parafulva]|uniref:Uncharacterized protein n=1 Tax=Pseudomonas parafulva TaxID=157782 RepID=A0AAI8PBQ7_9PSED|nr:hypothetical protein [Pseudomonas parafulva]AXO88710.1 hypothetical protein DZC75_12155 [Pseudomonas parafulva]
MANCLNAASAGGCKETAYLLAGRNEILTTFRREGFADHRVELDSTISGWYWGNILLGGVIGMLIVDPLTGAMYKLPQDVTVELEGQRRPHASAAASADLSIASIEDLTPAQRERLIPLH